MINDETLSLAKWTPGRCEIMLLLLVVAAAVFLVVLLVLM